MAIYRFRVAIEGDETVYRDIDMSSRHTFSDLQQAIVRHFNLQDGQGAEFFTTDQTWYEGDEIATLDGSLTDRGPRLSEQVNDPHQRFLCNTRSYNPLGLLIEMKKVLKDDPAIALPRLVANEGEPPVYTQPPPQHVEDTGEEDILPLSAFIKPENGGDDNEPELGPGEDEMLEFGDLEDGDATEIADPDTTGGDDDVDMMDDEDGDGESGDDMGDFGSFDPDDM